MRKKRIALIGLDADGEIHPSLRLVKTLLQRGHEVDYLLPEMFSKPGRFREIVNALGARHVLCPLNMESWSSVWTQVPKSIFAHSRKRMVQAAVAMLPSILRYCEMEKPDVLLLNRYSFTAMICARRYGIPSAMFHPTYCGSMNWLFDFEDKEQEQKAFEEYIKSLGSSYPEAPHSLEELIAEHESCNIVFMSKQFHPHGEQFDSRYHFVGAQMQPNCPLPIEQRKRVYVSLGTVFSKWNVQFFSKCIEAFGSSKWDLVISVGRDDILASFGTLPPNVKVLQYANQVEILRGAAAFVTHGGMNSIQEAIWNEVPMVVVPQAFDQHISARRIAELGCGVALSQDASGVTPGWIENAVTQIVASAQISENLKRERQYSEASGGIVRSAQLITSLAM